VKYLSLPASLVAFASLLMTIPAHADTALESQLRAAYSNQCKLVMSGDYAGLTQTLSPDFVNVQPDGTKQTRDQIIALTKQAMQMSKLTGCDVTFVRTTQNADGSVTAVVTETQSGILNSAPLQSISTSTDTWVQQNGKWIVKGSVTSEATVKVNGNVVQHVGGTPAPPSPAPTSSP
jgi:hypothetical protein